MNFVADESVEQQIIEALRQVGHDVFAVSEQAAGLNDEDVLLRATQDRRILLTSDKDFGELIYRAGQNSAGVIFLRLAGLSNTLKATAVTDAIRDHAQQLAGAFTVVEPGRVRVRSA